jgi:hypothetical protein
MIDLDPGLRHRLWRALTSPGLLQESSEAGFAFNGTRRSYACRCGRFASIPGKAGGWR